jgi:AraC family transcriptional regulator, ethanolamine operon transcriptional activator
MPDAAEEVVERAEAYLRAHVGKPVSISRVSRHVGLSERGLRNAFYRVRGMSPTRCLRVERLEGVRRALRDRRTERLTVTDVAVYYGFYQLGRFAAEYKKAFGEVPSETLRGTERDRLQKTDLRG